MQCEHCTACTLQIGVQFYLLQWTHHTTNLPIPSKDPFQQYNAHAAQHTPSNASFCSATKYIVHYAHNTRHLHAIQYTHFTHYTHRSTQCVLHTHYLQTDRANYRMVFPLHCSRSFLLFRLTSRCLAKEVESNIFINIINFVVKHIVHIEETFDIMHTHTTV